MYSSATMVLSVIFDLLLLVQQISGGNYGVGAYEIVSVNSGLQGVGGFGGNLGYCPWGVQLSSIPPWCLQQRPYYPLWDNNLWYGGGLPGGGLGLGNSLGLGANLGLGGVGMPLLGVGIG